MLAPGVAFTRDGGRLGHGAGYYDRYLTEHRRLIGRAPRTIGLALREQLVDEVPMTDRDVRLDRVIAADNA